MVTSAEAQQAQQMLSASESALSDAKQEIVNLKGDIEALQSELAQCRAHETDTRNETVKAQQDLEVAAETIAQQARLLASVQAELASQQTALSACRSQLTDVDGLRGALPCSVTGFCLRCGAC